MLNCTTSLVIGAIMSKRFKKLLAILKKLIPLLDRMHYSEPQQLLVMNNARKNWRKLKRKEFNSLMTEANLDYLFDRKMNPRKYAKADEFNPMTTPNRNPEQVPNGLWLILLYNHLHNYINN